MKNNIYDLINDGEFNEEIYGDMKLNDIEKRKMKNNFKKSIHKEKGKYKKVAAGFIVTVAVSGLFLNTEVGAKALNAVTRSIESFLNINKNIDDYKTEIDKSVTDNGFTIKLNEVIFDNNKLIISKNITCNRELNDDDFCDAYETVYINGEKIKFSSGSGGDEKIDEYTRQLVSEFELSELDYGDLSEDLDVKIVYKNISLITGDLPEDIHGNWEFEFKVNKDVAKKTLEANKTMDIDGEFVLQNEERVILEKYKSNDMEQRIYAKKENSSQGEVYDIKLKGTDDLGNEVEFYCSESDDDGYIFDYYNGEKNIDENATELILKPYAIKFDSLMKSDDNNYEQVGEKFVIYLK